MIFNNSTSEQCKSKFKMQFSYPNSKFRKETDFKLAAHHFQ